MQMFENVESNLSAQTSSSWSTQSMQTQKLNMDVTLLPCCCYSQCTEINIMTFIYHKKFRILYKCCYCCFHFRNSHICHTGLSDGKNGRHNVQIMFHKNLSLSLKAAKGVKYLGKWTG